MAILPVNTVLGPITEDQKQAYFGHFSEIRQICSQGSASDALNRYRQLPWFKHHGDYDSKIARLVEAKMQLASDLVEIMKVRNLQAESFSFLKELTESPCESEYVWEDLRAIHDDQMAWFWGTVPENEAERKPREPGWETATWKGIASQFVEQRLKEIQSQMETQRINSTN